jgi:hypothetical protein
VGLGHFDPDVKPLFRQPEQSLIQLTTESSHASRFESNRRPDRRHLRPIAPEGQVAKARPMTEKRREYQKLLMRKRRAAAKAA